MKKNKPVNKPQTSDKQPAILLSMATLQDLRSKNRWKLLFAPVDISSIIFFRIIFGLILFIEVLRYFSHGWIGPYWIEPTHLFAYWPFDFLKPLPGDGMYFLFMLMGALAICIMVGLFYRVSMTLFFVCFTYMFLLDQTLYLNHFYLVVLVSFLMIFIPAHRAGSLDSRFRPAIQSQTAPAWSLWLLRFMIGIAYFYGGVAKINPDWLQGEPLRMWLSGSSKVPILGPFLQYDWMIYFLSYSGLLLDLLIIPVLLIRPLRKWGFLCILIFHLLNTQLFSIGIFPWFMIAATTLFLDPGWYRNLISTLKAKPSQVTVSATRMPDILLPKHKIILAALGLWMAIQMALPLRHFFIDGNVHWTEQGHLYAWHMKLRSKRGKGNYLAKDKKTGQEYFVSPADYLLPRQISKMNRDPHLIWQFCQWVKEDYKSKGMDVAVYANIKASLNGRKYQQLVDSTVDLAAQPIPIMPAKWIVPLQTPLSSRIEKKTDKNTAEDEKD